ncbi:MAG: TVP38/TMEM64 family protein [Bacillota bacterium]
MSQTSIQKWIKIAAFGLLVVATGAIALFAPQFFPELYVLLKTGHIQKVADYLASYGMFAVFLSIYANTLINILGFPPSIIISTANGITFGIVGGTFVSWIAECFGTILGFILMKSLLRPTAIKLVEKSKYLKKIDEFSGSNGFKLVLFMRMMPYFPSVLITALAAVSNISLRNYIIATLIGKFPSTAIEVIVGHDLVNYQEHLTRLTIFGIVLIVGYTAAVLIMRRKRKAGE